MISLDVWRVIAELLETLAFDSDFLLAFLVIYPDTLKLQSANDWNEKCAEYKKGSKNQF